MQVRAKVYDLNDFILDQVGPRTNEASTAKGRNVQFRV